MTVTGILFESGLRVGQSVNSVKPSKGDLTFVELFAEIWNRYRVRPVLRTETISSFGSAPEERHTVFTLDAKELLNLRISELTTPQGLAEATYISLLRPMMNVQYTAGAMVYHCQELALRYAGLCHKASTLRRIMPIEGDVFTYQDASEGYYEVEALITAARRTFDALRYILWAVFGPGGGSTPSNFPKSLAGCVNLPDALRESLESSWSDYGERVTEYRDCLQHNVPVTSQLQHAMFRRIDEDHWSVRLPLPDNPEVKSQKAFTFAKNLDALTYGWEVANEVIAQAVQVFAAIPVGKPATPPAL
jgi:hypothetical protein